MSDIYLDTSYIHKISYKLEKFHKVKKDTYAFRCPICGDSKGKLDATRGNLQVYKGQVFSGCYRCGKSFPFPAFLKRIDESLFKEYLRESFGSQKRVVIKDEVIENKKPEFVSHALDFSSRTSYAHFLDPEFNDMVKRIDLLKDNHPAKKYCIKRGLQDHLHRLYYTNTFKRYSNWVKPDSFENEYYDTPRLIIPFFDKEGQMFAFQGRSFNPKSKTKYITIKIDEDMPKIYGLDTLDENKPVFLLEGPINSMFVDNAVAATGSNLLSYKGLFDDVTYVYDNDARNPQIVQYVRKSLQNDNKTVIWTKQFDTGIDINDISKMGLSNERITKYLKDNTYQGLMGLVKFEQWRKI